MPKGRRRAYIRDGAMVERERVTPKKKVRDWSPFARCMHCSPPLLAGRSLGEQRHEENKSSEVRGKDKPKARKKNTAHCTTWAAAVGGVIHFTWHACEYLSEVFSVKDISAAHLRRVAIKVGRLIQRAIQPPLPPHLLGDLNRNPHNQFIGSREMNA